MCCLDAFPSAPISRVIQNITQFVRDNEEIQIVPEPFRGHMNIFRSPYEHLIHYESDDSRAQ